VIDEQTPLCCGVCGAETDITAEDLAPLPAGMLSDVEVFCDVCSQLVAARATAPATKEQETR